MTAYTLQSLASQISFDAKLHIYLVAHCRTLARFSVSLWHPDRQRHDVMCVEARAQILLTSTSTFTVCFMQRAVSRFNCRAIAVRSIIIKLFIYVEVE